MPGSFADGVILPTSGGCALSHDEIMLRTSSEISLTGLKSMSSFCCAVIAICPVMGGRIGILWKVMNLSIHKNLYETAALGVEAC